MGYLDGLYDVGIGIIILSTLIIIIFLFILISDPLVNSWISLYLLGLLIFLFIGFGLIAMYYQYSSTLVLSIGPVPIPIIS
ncbi:MAG TPA: hypothetical protein VKR58_06615, partial [Aquella sp.]|nr:hypothetical protein [Aquella sp.]